MSWNRYYALVGGVAVAASLAVVLAWAFGAFPSGSGAPEGEARARNAISGPGGGPTEGITVHGHWTIEVREPDGKLVSRSEFENAFLNPRAMARIMARQISVGSWEVILYPASGGTKACPPTGVTVFLGGCRVVEGNSALTDSNVFKTLTLSVPTSGTNANKLVLSGTATAQQDGSVGFVETRFYECTPSTAPSTPCVSGATGATLLNIFTQTTLASPVNVVNGQQILATVVISFS